MGLRMIKIGDSYFGHKKLLKGDFASGSGAVGWEAPPRQLLEMLDLICQKGKFNQHSSYLLRVKHFADILSEGD